jgi:hypothetical protein
LSPDLKFAQKYSFLFNRESLEAMGKLENLNITFGYAYRYTNFSINIFYLSLITPDESDRQESNTSKTNNEHQLRIYRFWTYDLSNDLPLESAYFLKMIQIINFNNPVVSNKFSSWGIKKPDPYPKDGHSNVCNYLLHSE